LHSKAPAERNDRASDFDVLSVRRHAACKHGAQTKHGPSLSTRSQFSSRV
jgi:hypothetical protein